MASSTGRCPIYFFVRCLLRARIVWQRKQRMRTSFFFFFLKDTVLSYASFWFCIFSHLNTERGKQRRRQQQQHSWQQQPIEAVKKGGNRTKVTLCSGNNSGAKESFFFSEIKSSQTLYCKVADKDEHNARRLLLDLRCLIETETRGREKIGRDSSLACSEELTDRLKIR